MLSVDPELGPGELLTWYMVYQDSVVFFIAGGPEIKDQIVDITSTADDKFLSLKNTHTSEGI